MDWIEMTLESIEALYSQQVWINGSSWQTICKTREGFIVEAPSSWPENKLPKSPPPWTPDEHKLYGDPLPSSKLWIPG